MYRQVHKYSEVTPWCTYALEHPISVGASSLSMEDLSRFMYRDVPTKQLFHGCVPHPDDTKLLFHVMKMMIAVYGQVVVIQHQLILPVVWRHAS